LVHALERIGFVVKRQRGSHIILRRENPPARVVVPDHRNLRIGTVRTILNTAGLTVEELLKLLWKPQANTPVRSTSS
jgi:predicted RNA binding protein YcfA (HicA-like mRNA interferase family)